MSHMAQRAVSVCVRPSGCHVMPPATSLFIFYRKQLGIKQKRKKKFKRAAPRHVLVGSVHMRVIAGHAVLIPKKNK